ncbi:MAG: ornithine carbamoyltransferase [Gammaproteobacteria bacterium]
MKPDFLSLKDLTGLVSLNDLLARALELKHGATAANLEGRTLMLLFEKPSTRTRLSFSAGMTQMGGQCLYMPPSDAQLSRGEPLEDVARVAGTMVDAVAIRTAQHERLKLFALYCQVPVINALSDWLHPCQTLADLLTVIEEYGSFRNIQFAWIGDGNNSLNSWLEASALLNLKLRFACPKGYEPDADLLASAPSAQAVDHPHQAIRGAQVVSTDVWTSMNQEAEQAQRDKDFKGYQVSSSLMSQAAPNAILLHCLPAYRGKEVTAEVLTAPCSRIWKQAENRLHTQKALLEQLILPRTNVGNPQSTSPPLS